MSFLVLGLEKKLGTVVTIKIESTNSIRALLTDKIVGGDSFRVSEYTLAFTVVAGGNVITRLLMEVMCGSHESEIAQVPGGTGALGGNATHTCMYKT